MGKVLQVVYNMDCGGIEKFIISMYDELVKENINFDFIYMNEENTKSYYDNHILENGGKIFYVGKLNFKKLLKFIKKFKKIIKENGPYDALHVHSYYNCGFISLLAKCCGIKNIITHAHSTKDNKTSNSIIRKIYRAIAKILINIFSDQKLACGYEAGKSLYGKSNFTIINNGIDVNKFINISFSDLLKKQKEINYNNERTIVHVGSFLDVKNHEYILKIAKKLKDRNENFKILLIGDGPLKETIKNKINQLNLSKNVLLLGLKNDVEKYLCISDVFIMPSKYEGFPISLIEAQASGLSCVVSNRLDKSVNLGINDFSFVDIKDVDVDKWCDTIIKSKKRKNLDISLNKIRENLMDSYSNAMILKNIYFEVKNEKK